jgi:peptidoglycan DL-endopeptidase CwlO
VTRRRRVTAGAAALVTAAGMLLVGTVLPATPAAADTIGDAQASAAAIAAKVHELQTKAEVATEAYDAAEAHLAEAVTRQSLAQQQVDADQAAAAGAAAQADARIRALYESGGRTTLFATVLAGSDPADTLAGLHVIGNLFTFDAADVAASSDVAAVASQRAAALDTTAREVTQLQHAAALAAGRVRLLLIQQRRALRDANAHVRQLVAQQQAAQAAADAASFRDAILAAGGSLLTGTTVPPDQIAGIAIETARSRLGAPYVWGGSGPSVFDCSGLVQWSYAHAGLALPRVAADQYNVGQHIDLDQLQPGDLLFWATDVNDPATIHHVAMYIGGGMMIAAPHTGTVVQIQPVYLSGYIGATRPYVAASAS